MFPYLFVGQTRREGSAQTAKPFSYKVASVAPIVNIDCGPVV